MSAQNFNPFASGELLRVSPTTKPQQEIIASAQISDEANTAFNEAVSLTISGNLDTELLKRCFDLLLARHDILRATFSRKGNEICLQEKLVFSLDYEDLRPLDAAQQQQEISSLWRNIALSPMNLEEGPLFFAWLKQLADDRFELILAMHHLVCDGWSTGLLLKELEQIYTQNGSDDSLDPAPSFFEFAEQMDAKEVLNADADYWRQRFETLPPTMDLPLDRVRPPVRTFQADRIDYDLGPEIVAALPKAAAQQKASLVNLVLAGYFALLHRLSGSDDIVVGLPVAGQTAHKRPDQVGHLVQLLPIRAALTEQTTFAELVDQIKREVLNASEHPNFTFGALIEKITVDRSRVPLINTIFNIDQPMGELDFGGAKGQLRTVPRAAENFEMFLNVVPSPQKLTIEATYSTALFSEATIRAWLAALECLLTEAIADPAQPIVDLKLSSQVPAPLAQSNATDTPVAAADFIRAFQAQVEKTPDDVATLCSGQSLSYAELNRLADGMAMQLRDSGLGQGDVIGICCERSNEMLAAIIAIFKLGAAYLPLDPDFPPDRLVYMMEDSGAVAVIEDGAAPQGVRQAEVKHQPIDSLAQIAADVEPSQLPDPNPDRLSYIIYTSGSTGKPKGVPIHCRAMINFLESMAKVPGCSATDRLLAFTTLSFDISVLELYLPLIVGASTVIATRAEAKDGQKLAALIKAHQVTLVQATPATWRMLLASEWGENALAEHSGLKTISGGEPLLPDLAASLLPRVSSLWNGFGPTEATVYATFKQITTTDELITIGTPVDNTQIYILDKNRSPLPVSAPGELFIGGEGLAVGYHDRPELSAERFIDHPDFGKIYATGDLAKVLPNGEIQHLGRLDDQVKLRGYRIELGEIESALTDCPGVASAAAYLWEITPEDVRIVACCIPSDSAGLNTLEIRKTLRQKLPNYMIPQYLLDVADIPKTPSGKFDRKKLPRPELAETSILSGSALQTDTEKRVAEIWSELIKVKGPIHREDNFFEIGGHSLLALQAIHRIEVETKKRLTPAEFVKDNLVTICQRIDSATEDTKASADGPTALSAATERALSPEQARLLERQLKCPGSTASNLPAGWVLEGPLDVAAFQKSLERLIERQTALRTLITGSAGNYHQVLCHISDLEVLERIDCSDSAEPMDEAMRQIVPLIEQPFTPIDNRLFYAKLFTLAEDRYFFFFMPHQVIFDGWSFDIFLKELAATYQAYVSAQQPSLENLALEYRDFSHWLHGRSADESHLAFHRQTIETATDRVSDSRGESKGRSQRQEHLFPPAELQKVEAFCTQHGLRLHEFLFAAFARVLAEVQGRTDILMGMPVSGRQNADSIGLIGSFVTTLPCRVRLDQTDLLSSLKSTAAQLKQFLDHQDVSYAEVARGTSKQDQLFPAFIDASFAYQDIRNRPTKLHDLALKQIDMPRKQTEMPIEFWTRIQPNGLLAVFDYDAGLIDPALIASVASALAKQIETLDLDAVTSEEQPQVEQQPVDVPGKPLWRRLFSK